MSVSPSKLDYAGFWLRLIAHIIDNVLVYMFTAAFWLLGLILPLAVIASLAPDYGGQGTPLLVQGAVIAYVVVWIVMYFALGLIYFAWFESSPFRATPGKLVLGLMVCNVNGNQLSFWRAFGRNAAKQLSYWTLYIGFLLAAFTTRKQALHDLVASCLVVRKPKKA